MPTDAGGGSAASVTLPANTRPMIDVRFMAFPRRHGSFGVEAALAPLMLAAFGPDILPLTEVGDDARNTVDDVGPGDRRVARWPRSCPPGRGAAGHAAGPGAAGQAVHPNGRDGADAGRREALHDRVRAEGAKGAA